MKPSRRLAARTNSVVNVVGRKEIDIARKVPGVLFAFSVLVRGPAPSCERFGPLLDIARPV
jgi:hypothetical protein